MNYADSELAGELMLQSKRWVLPKGLRWFESPDVQTIRIITALVGITATTAVGVSVTPRMHRFIQGQISEAAQWARSEAGIRHRVDDDLVVGWVRRVSSTACDWCVMVRGTPPAVHPVEHRLAKHPGHCHCSQQYVTRYDPPEVWMGTLNRYELAKIQNQTLPSEAYTGGLRRRPANPVLQAINP